MTKKNILAIIPARGGSKGIPHKNIIDLLGKPLIAWTIEASLNSKYITKTIVSSDDDEILKISQQFGAQTIKRPSNLAQDETPSEPVIEHVLDTLTEKFEYIILLQPTSPLRDHIDIDNAFKHLFQSQATALISVNKINNKILKAFIKNENGYIQGITNNKFPFSRRQDLPDTVISNGAIYIIKTDSFCSNKSLLTNQTIPYLLSEEKSKDIDILADLKNIRDYLDKLKK